MTGISAEQAWADLAFNPTNVPRQVPTPRMRFMPLEPITLKQANLLNHKILDNAFGQESVRKLFGEGFVSVDRLSSWAASWAIGEIEEYESRAYDDAEIAAEARLERAMKAVIADHYRARHPELRRVTVDD